MTTNLPGDDPRTQRILQEYEALRAKGYDCALHKHAADGTCDIKVQMQRPTMEGDQPYSILLTLDPLFPARRPGLEVEAFTGNLDPNGELRGLLVDVESKTRLIWANDNTLVQIVEDVQDFMQTGALQPRRADPPPPEPDDRPIDPEPEPREEKEPTHSNDDAPRTFVRDTPLRKPGGEAAPWATFTIRELTPEQRRWLRIAGISIGGLLAITLLAAIFSLVAPYLPSRTGPTATPTREQELWNDANTLAKAETPENMSKLVAALQQIEAINPVSANPAGGMTVTLQLSRAWLAWGDMIYKQEPSDAALQYGEAHKLMPNDGDVIDRSAWVERARDWRDANISTWPDLIAELSQAAGKDSKLTDPAGRSIAQWLYDAHLAYGQALYNRGSAATTVDTRQSDIKTALEQADAALKLAGAKDKGEAARRLKEQAETLRDVSGSYKVFVDETKPTKEQWGQLVDKQKSEAFVGTAADALPNLVIYGPEQTTLVLTGPDNKPVSIAIDRDGRMLVALPQGESRLRLDDGLFPHEKVLVISENMPYHVVQITPTSAR